MINPPSAQRAGLGSRDNARRRHISRVTEAALSPSAAARSRLVASWRRSLVKHKLDPGDSIRKDRLTQGALKDLRDESGDLHAIAACYLDRLFQRVKLSGCAIFLTDAQGVVLNQRCQPGDESDFAAWNLWAGSDWSEGSEGTNGVGTAITEERAVIIHRDEHYSLRNIAMSCIGAPIFAADGSLMGVLDISSARADQSGAMNALLLDAVQQAALQIEAALFRRAYPGTRIVLAEPEAPDTTLTDTPARQCLVAVDGHDVVIGANRSARRRFGLAVGGAIDEVPCVDLLGQLGRQGGIDGAERAALRRALLRAGGNVSAAAKALGISRATLYRRMERLGLNDKSDSAS